MNAGGWLTLLLSVGSVVALFAWCIWKVLVTHDTEGHIHGIEDIEKGED